MATVRVHSADQATHVGEKQRCGRVIAAGHDFPVAAAQLFGNVRLDFPSGQKQLRRLVSLPVGDCRLSQLQAGVHTVHGERVAAHSFDPDALKLIIQVEGHSVIEQGGTRVEITNHAPIVYDPTRPYRLENKTPVRLLMLQLPRERFPQAILRRLSVPLLSGPEGLTPILLAMMHSTMQEADNVGPATRAGVGSAMTELVRALIEDVARPAQETRRPSLDLLLERVKNFISDNLPRADLSIALIARRMGCSPRYVFRAFETEGETPAEYLWKLRLEKAHEHLRANDERVRSITDIAFSLGFSSTAHFSRAFRERYDMTPGDYRRRG